MPNNTQDWKGLPHQINVAKHLGIHMVINDRITCKIKLWGGTIYESVGNNVQITMYVYNRILYNANILPSIKGD